METIKNFYYKLSNTVNQFLFPNDYSKLYFTYGEKGVGSLKPTNNKEYTVLIEDINEHYGQRLS